MLRTIFYTIWSVLCYYTVIFKAYRFKYNCIFTKNPIISGRLHIFGSITGPTKRQIIEYGNILLGVHFNLRLLKLKSDY